MVGFTIQSIVKSVNSITINTTSGLSMEFVGTPEEIHNSLKSSVGDTDPVLPLKMFLLRALHLDRNMDNPSIFSNKVVNYDVRSTTMLTVL